MSIKLCTFFFAASLVAGACESGSTPSDPSADPATTTTSTLSEPSPTPSPSPTPTRLPSTLTTTPASDVPRLPKIVLAAGSVPSGFTLTLEEDYTPEELSAYGTYTLEDLRSWGYLGGYEREFERRDESDPMKISSDAGAYRTNDGIARAFQRNVVNCQTGGWRILRDDVKLGTESMLCSRDTTIRGYDARVFFVIWYSGRIKSAVTVTGLLGKNSPELALQLARRQAANY